MKVIEATVQGTMNEILRSSYRLSKSVKNREDTIDKVWDTTLEFSSIIQEEINQLNAINTSLSRLTWITDTSNRQNIEDIEIILRTLNNLKDDELKGVNEYITDHFPISKECPKTIKVYLGEIEDLEENLDDVYNAFFVLPYDEEYQELQRLIADCP